MKFSALVVTHQTFTVTYLRSDAHDYRSHRIVLVHDPRQRSLKDGRHVLHVDHREDELGGVVEATVKDAQLDGIDLTIPIVEGLAQSDRPAEHVNVRVPRTGYDLEVIAEIGGREAADLQDVAD